jgi:ssDNA-binding replication factor A large subunit
VFQRRLSAHRVDAVFQVARHGESPPGDGASGIVADEVGNVNEFFTDWNPDAGRLK